MDAERLDIEKTLRYLTLDEKLRMLSGDGMWHTFGAGELPRVFMSDGPNGLRTVTADGASAIPATCYPTASMLANSWDPALIYGVGAAIGREATALGVNLVLAPGLNIKRNPLGGRNFEYFSEDPLLTGELGKAFVSGVQSTGVGACVKHFCCNEQEAHRMYSDSVVDPRAFREIYLRPFEIALEADPAAVMCAYNKFNGTYCSESEYLLKTILRDELKYKGVTVSDWGAVHSRVRSFKAGLDIEMPDSYGLYKDELDAAVKSGDITESELDDSLRRTLELIDNVYLEPYGDYDADAHDKLCYNAAVSSVVLLKNDNNTLPLNKAMRIAVMGTYAEASPIQGFGSSHVTALKALSPLEAYAMRSIDVTYFRGYDPDPKKNSVLFDEAMHGSAEADIVIVHAGVAAPAEGIDRKNIELPIEQNKLITALTNAGRRVVVVLTVPGPVSMPWIKRVRAIVYSGLCGQNGALAACDVLFGRINPRGKLAETFPIDDGELGTDFGKRKTFYRESIFVGYRYYDSIKRRVLFPFGHGLSFADISYDDMTVKATGDCDFDVTFTLTNNSARDAYETAQIYVSDKTGRIMTPEKQLAAFAKIFVEGKTTTKATLHINKRAFSFFDARNGKFAVPRGKFVIMLGASSEDIRKELTVELEGDFDSELPPPSSYVLPIKNRITDADFQTLYVAPLPEDDEPTKKGDFTLDNCITDLSGTLAGKIAAGIVKKRAKAIGEAGPERDAFIASAMTTPLYAAATMSDGAMSLSVAEALVALANGKYLTGIKLLLKRKDTSAE